MGASSRDRYAWNRQGDRIWVGPTVLVLQTRFKALSGADLGFVPRQIRPRDDRSSNKRSATERCKARLAHAHAQIEST